MLQTDFKSAGRRPLLVPLMVAAMVMLSGQLPANILPAEAAGTGSGLRGEYFVGSQFGASKLVRTDSALNFDWHFGSPDPSVTADGFSVRWTGQVQPLYSENYTFYTVADDGVRVKVNGLSVIDDWSDHPWAEKAGGIALTGGQKYDITMEYYERTGAAVAKLLWSSQSQAKEVIPQSQLYPSAGTAIINSPVIGSAPSDPAASGGFKGDYFSDAALQSLKLSRNDSKVNFDWGGGSPDSSLPSDNFSVRWTGKVTPKFSEIYTIRSITDDGVRVWVNGNLIVDNWTDHARKEDYGSLNLNAGQQYDIKMEYYERGGGAIAQLFWSSASQPSELIGSSSAGSQSAQLNPTIAPSNNGSMTSNSSNPFSGMKLYVNPQNDPKKWADANRNSRPADARLMDKIASQPESVWLGDWNPNPQQDANNFTNAITQQGAYPVFVLYNVPLRDCGSYSAGGAQSPQAYRDWVRGVAAGIGNRKAAVILEPDGLSNIDCMSAADQATRISLINEAVQILSASGSVSVYIDAGNPNWVPADVMANRLKAAGIANARGFALSISNFFTDQQNVDYGTKLSQLTGGKRFVAERSRNGLGPTPDYQWCNPAGRALGLPPTTNTGNSLVDAFLWVKGPGGSDGQCNGGPAAGVFWPEYALGLAQRASW